MNNEKATIRLNDIIYSVFDGKWIVAACTVLALLAGILFSAVGYVRGEMSKQYKFEASVIVSSQIKNSAFSTDTPHPIKDDISLAKEITEQAMYIMKSDKAVSTAVEKLGMVGVSAKSIKNNLTLTRYNDSQIFEISFLWRSKDEGVKILKALEDTTNDILLSTMMIGHVVSVNDPTATYIFGGKLSISTWLIFALAGAAVGAAICVIKRMFHQTLLWTEDLEAFFDLEVLETIQFDPKLAQADPFTIEPGYLDAEISSAAYILLNRIERAGIKTVFITSAGRKEGRSTLLADWAVKLSETGKHVLLVDCDFSNPSLAPLFHVDLKYENTLNALFNGDSDVSDAVVRLTPCLSLLPYILEETPDPLSLPMLQVIESVAETYDLVLIDAAPVGSNAEVLRLNAIADAALFLVKYDSASIVEIENALTRLRKINLPILGAVVNGTKSLRSVMLEFKKPTRIFRKREKNGSGTRTQKREGEKTKAYK
ncbi:MAG: hypothetical protein IJU56_05905 [Clostridia bacterium]|nr:hypothetical protein [Clostridia bacterium]